MGFMQQTKMFVYSRRAFTSPTKQQATAGKRRLPNSVKLPSKPAPPSLKSVPSCGAAMRKLPRINRGAVEARAAIALEEEKCVVRNHVQVALRDGTNKLLAQARPSWRTLRALAVQRGVPYVGFGLVDNAIMIVSGDYIEMNIGVALGIGTMASAALGNVIADVLGINLGGLIEDASYRMGLPEPRLSRTQLDMGVTKIAGCFGPSLGIAFGCLLGMIPLVFLGDQEDDSPPDICQVLAHRAIELLQCERVLVDLADLSAGTIKEHQFSDEPLSVPSCALARELAEQVVLTKKPASYTAEARGTILEESKLEEMLAERVKPLGHEVKDLLAYPVLSRNCQLIAVVTVINTRQHRPLEDDYGIEEIRIDYRRVIAGVCSQIAEAIINTTRRAEEHVSLSESLELLQLHSDLVATPYSPRLVRRMTEIRRRDTSTRSGVLLRQLSSVLGHKTPL